MTNGRNKDALVADGTGMVADLDVNILHYGDNLMVLRERIPNECVDLIYLDPPFNSQRDYNIIYQERDGTEPASQIRAFEDTWRWDQKAADTFKELCGSRRIPVKVSALISSLDTVLHGTDMMAYIVMMAIRLVELHRVLKSSGSLYLHCDPAASHYLKVVLDIVFGPSSFRNEIVWRRTGAHAPPRRFGPVHDTILFYAKSPKECYFKAVRVPYMRGHVASRYTLDETGQLRFTSGGNVITGAGIRTGESGMPWRGFDPTAKGRHWAIPGFLAEEMSQDFQDLGVLAKLDALLAEGLIRIEPRGAWPIPVRYLKEDSGSPMSDIWAYQSYTEGTVHGTEAGIDADVQWLGPTDPERLNYPTQKPVGLLERIICASSRPGDVVLDPFCGCGTAIDAAQRLKRKWIGIDVTHLAIAVVESRLRIRFRNCKYDVRGLPEDENGARKLASEDQFGFQSWAVGKIGARPMAIDPDGRAKRGMDRGRDGLLLFTDEKKTSVAPKRIIVSAKAGHVGSKDVRELAGALDQHKAVMGALVTMEEPTREMRIAAMDMGDWRSTTWNNKAYPRIQLISVSDIFRDDKRIEFPGRDMTFDSTEWAHQDEKQLALLAGAGQPKKPQRKRKR